MPVPKRKTSRSRRDKRAANKGLKPPSLAYCYNGSCDGEPKLPHEVCLKCGFYKGKKVLTTKQDRELKRAEARKALQAKGRGTQAKSTETVEEKE